MALRRELSKRFHHLAATRLSACPSLPAIVPPSARLVREYMTSSETSGQVGFFRRFLQRRAINQASKSSIPSSLSEILNLPVGYRLREKLRETSIIGVGVSGRGHDDQGILSVENARKILRAAEVERVKGRVREVAELEGRAVVNYDDFVKICVEACGGWEAKGLEFARFMDDSGCVIMLGNLVFLLPEQVAKSIEKLIYQTIPMPNDPRRKELEKMEEKKAEIEEKARKLVKRELYFGLGILSAQTICFMRLTFWELSWDVMEPICFFVTSSYFALAYGFFLRTSKEPSFEGYYQRRFEAKRAKLIKAHNFDMEKYLHLRQVFYPTTATATNTTASVAADKDKQKLAFCS